MAVPKRRTSKTRRDKRRTHKKISMPNTSECPQCGEDKMPHRICPSCGSYDGRQVIEVE